MNVIMGKFSSKRNKDFWNEFALTSKDNKFGASVGEKQSFNGDTKLG